MPQTAFPGLSVIQGTAKVIETIVHAIQEKKGEKVISLDLRDITESICDYFIICQGDYVLYIFAGVSHSRIVCCENRQPPQKNRGQMTDVR